MDGAEQQSQVSRRPILRSDSGLRFFISTCRYPQIIRAVELMLSQ